MLSRRLLSRAKIPQLLVRCQSTVVHPVSKLGNELYDQLKSGDANEVYSTLKDHLDKISQELVDPTTLQRSFGLNAPLTQFLRKAATDKESTVEPYQILNTLCQYQVARSPHFEVVMRHLLTRGSPQDVIALWVKYLETIAENPNAMSRSFNNRNGNNNSHENNMALASLAYLLLPENNPDLQVLGQILQLNKELGQHVPFNKLRFMISSLIKDERREAAQQGLKLLFHQYVDSDKESFIRQLDQTLQFHHLQDLYNQYHEQSVDPEIIAKFMEKYIDCNNAAGAVKIYNENKDLDSSMLKDHLLLAVANLPANSRNLRLDRILAIWNSVIKPTNPGAASFAALIRALGVSGNVQQLQNIWTKEIPQEIKLQSPVIEGYLTAMLKYNKQVKYDDIAGKLPEKIESSNLINAVLLKMVIDNVSKEKFDSFYAAQFAKTEDVASQKRPNVETLAIRMYANYHYASDKDSFDFLKSVFQSKKNFLKVNAIIEHFIQIVPSIEPIRVLYAQVKEPVDSRKYGAFINAEFVKHNGDYKVAEEIFKEFLEALKAQSKKIDRFSLEPLITGFCEQAIRDRDPSFLLKVSTYYSFASKVNLELTYQTTAKILHTLALLAKDKSGKFDASEQEFIGLFLQDLESMEKFNPNSRDIDMLRKAGVKLPGKLA